MCSYSVASYQFKGQNISQRSLISLIDSEMTWCQSRIMILISPCPYTLNKSSKWYIEYICRVFQKGLNADKSFHYFDFLCIINISNVVFIHFKSSYQYQFTSKTMTSKAKWRLKAKQSRCRKCCASVKLLSENGFRWVVYLMTCFTRTVAILQVVWSLPVC